LDKAKVLVWDLGGQEALRTLWDKYFEEAHGLIYVIDCADKERIKESHQELGTVSLWKRFDFQK
jgi:ADP-ribosylation factor related protein 1